VSSPSAADAGSGRAPAGDASAREVVERIRRRGPIPFGELVELALYGPGGFFTSGGGAGRAGRDFVTSPTVGPLFGACVARAVDREWDRRGRPDPFLVVEAGAGDGRLALDVLRAAPACTPALHYVVVERSPVLRAAQADRLPLEPGAHLLGPSARAAGADPLVPLAGIGPVVSALSEVPAVDIDALVLANELLDNLPFDVVARDERGWSEVRVGVGPVGELVEVLLPAAPELAAWVAGVPAPPGTRLPVARAAVDWITTVTRRLPRATVVLVDYAAPWRELIARGGGWLRTYATHARGSGPLRDVGRQDITADVPIEMVEAAAARVGVRLTTCTQGEWLRGLGVDDLVAEGRARWEAGAAAPDLAALAGRSRVTEAAALLEPSGLGAHTVFELRAG
jgi:SAM-dependent MidA family methyltransferase